nr:DNA translocase FtsK [Methylobacterium trifolii]
MSLRASLTRRLAGAPARPGYAIAGTRPAPSWLTPPGAMVGRGAEPQVPYPAGSARSAPEAWPVAARDLWPDHVFDDRASLDMLEAARPESRIDVSASSPGVLVRSPRRPAAITPEGMQPAPGPTPSTPAPSPVPSAVRYTRTPDTILQERRQRALEAERLALERARDEAQAAAQAIEAAAHAARAAETERAAAAEAARTGAEPPPALPASPVEAEVVTLGGPVPLWRQPFVAPPGVRFFRTPDRRPARPAVELSASTAPAPRPLPAAQPRDLSELPDWSDAQPWFGGGDWSAIEGWASLEAEPAPSLPVAEDLPPAAAVPPVEAAAVAAAAERFVSVPLDISHLRSMPPKPVYVLDRLVRFDQPPRPADGQDNRHVAADAEETAQIRAAFLPRPPVLALVFGPGAETPSADAPCEAPSPAAAEPAPPVAEAPRRAPVLCAMAARAAIRSAGRPPAPGAAAEPVPAAPPEPVASAPAEPVAAFGVSGPPVVPVVPFVSRAVEPVPIPARPVLLRGKSAPAPEPVAEPVPEDAAEPPVAFDLEPVPAEAAEPEAMPLPTPAPLPASASSPLVVGRPHMIPSGRHLEVATFENADYELPALDLLAMPESGGTAEVDADVLEQNALNLQQTVQDFGVRGDILAVRPGPVVTLYELEPAPGTKSSRVIGLADDIARSMSAVSARVAVVPGRNVIGIELPNDTRETVFLRELLAAPDFFASKHKLALCLGKNIGGEPIIADLARMPHLLVAGTTGSGKSVAINTMILSLLYRMKPEECRLIMVDPKMLELSVYDGIPHLLSPVVIDPKKAVIALKWAVREMEERYKKMSKIAVRNIDGYNARMKEARERGEVITRTVQTGFNRETGEAVFEAEEMDLSALPYIVIVVDEMADLMMVAGKDIEGAIQRLAQMARAAGIHLIMATQRPSVDVITGTIKANFPTRISFQVTSKIDSRTILGEMGAEQLLGQGDMLFMAGGGRTTRVHGPFCSDSEVESVVAHLKRQGRPSYLDAVTADDGSEDAPKGKAAKADKAERIEEVEEDAPVFDVGAFVAASGGEAGDLYEQAIQVVLRDRKASTSYIQRRLQIGYNRAASIMERMEIEGIVGPANHAGKREILVEGAPHTGAAVYDDD